MVQDLIEKEFSVLASDGLDLQSGSELTSLCQALKILKVINFLYRNSHLISTKGIGFIINKSP